MKVTPMQLNYLCTRKRKKETAIQKKYIKKNIFLGKERRPLTPPRENGQEIGGKEHLFMQHTRRKDTCVRENSADLKWNKK